MTWRKICNLDTVPDDSMTAFNIDGIEILLVKGKEHYLVIPTVCPHMSTPLSEGFFDGCTLTCSKQLWQYSNEDGGAAVGIAEAPLLAYETREIDGALHVNVEHELKYEHQDEVD